MGDVEKSKLSLIQCFMCNGWTPPHLCREVVLDGISQRICVSCHRKLTRRVSALEIEAEREEEESASEDEIASAFGSAGLDET